MKSIQDDSEWCAVVLVRPNSIAEINDHVFERTKEEKLTTMEEDKKIAEKKKQNMRKVKLIVQYGAGKFI